jgi:uncharacterized alpha-E superfamily protein
MLSRVAETIFWMNRYMERAGNMARVMDVNFRLMLDLPSGCSVQWDALVRTTGDYDDFMERYGAATRENVIRFLTFDADNANSVLSCIRVARENARSVREIISSDVWEQLNRFYFYVSEAATKRLESPEDFFNETRLAVNLFVGLLHTTMSHGPAWHFARLGRVLERADQTSRILDVKYFILLPSLDDVGTPLDEIQWTAVLGSASALEAYRQKYGRVASKRAVEFLILDRDFPRAIHYCLIAADRSLHAITGTPGDTFNTPAERRLGQLRAEFDFTPIADIIGSGLHEYLDSFQTKLNVLGAAIHESFFALRPVTLPQGSQSHSHSQSQTQTQIAV